MKNATKHAEELRSLLKRLLKEHKPEPMVPRDPLRALVHAAMSFDVSDARAEEAMRAIEKEFVDLNELRVATDLEIQELLGEQVPAHPAARGDDHPVAQHNFRTRAHDEPGPAAHAQ